MKLSRAFISMIISFDFNFYQFYDSCCINLTASLVDDVIVRSTSVDLSGKSSITRSSSSGAAAPRISPQSLSISLEASGKNSPGAVSSEASKKHSPRVVRQLKTSPRFLEPTISSSKLATRAPKESSPRVSELKSPTSPLSEKKRPSRVAELESQISQLENDLKSVRDQLCSSETSEKQAQKDAEESKQQLLVLSSKLQESESKLLEQSASRNAHTVELSETPEQRDTTLQTELEALHKQQLQESAALTSALDEIEKLKAQLEMVAQSEATQTSHSESARIELHKLKENHEETLMVVAEMKNQLTDCKKSEAQAQELIGETLMQLEVAKKMVETLRLDGCKATEAHDSAACELEQSRARVEFLEELVSKLKSENNLEVEEKKAGESTEADFASLKVEVEQLRSALAVAEMRQNEEQARSAEQKKHALEMVEQINSASGQREAELEAELRKSSYEIEELKTNLMDKETELQCIFEENDALIMQLENVMSGHREQELHELKAEIKKMTARLNDKETENETLKMEMKEMSMANRTSNEVLSELETARAAEREALMKVGYMREEVEKSNRKAARVAEQLEAAQAGNAEMEAELRKLKVQSDQWRKAAEVAASMLSVGNNGQVVERTGSMDSNYSPRTRRVTSPYADDLDDDDDLFKKKNVNMLRRFGVLWKKPQK
ncbi:hypothetical protein C2S53_015850 [Perilla frutescens var. hirtella]|uniref:Interactor of constitutive active ROPs 3 n=1 Tax=Perilla frutescens var. hirtella TaxID=608512 RepID=A0AAD4IUZ3_PERFH|nr:hypothetical protein C2S53_015850 [Perilla frutescens var. hirtella]